MLPISLSLLSIYRSANRPLAIPGIAAEKRKQEKAASGKAKAKAKGKAKAKAKAVDPEPEECLEEWPEDDVDDEEHADAVGLETEIEDDDD